MAILNKCCYCINLQIGILIFGYIRLVYDLLRLGKCIQIALQFNTYLDNMWKTYEHEYNANDIDNEHEYNVMLNIEQQTRKIAGGFIYLFMVYLIIVLASVISLLIGTHTKKKHFIFPYLIIESFALAINLIAIFLVIIAWITTVIWETGTTEVGVITIIFFIVFGLNVYFFLCVISLYQKINENDRHPPLEIILMQPMGQGQKPYYA